MATFDDRAARRLMWFFAIVYTVEGIGQAKVGVVWQPLTYFLKQTFGWTPLQVSASLAVLDVPWVIKPLYGLVSDFLPLFGSRRRSYLLMANLLAAAAFAWVARVAAPAAIVPALTLTSIAMAVSSTLCGALLVENGQRLNASSAFINQQWLWFNIALMAASLLGGALIDWLPGLGALHAAAWIAAAAPLATLAGLPMVTELRAGLDRAALRLRLAGLLTVFRSGTLWLVAAFLFLYHFSPGFGTPLYFHLTDDLRFSQGFIGALSSVNAAGWIAGGLIYRFTFARIPGLALLRFSIWFGTLSTLAYLLMLDPFSAVAVYFVAGVAGMVANLATLTLAADYCPEGAEGFAFAALMSVINLAAPASDLIGSGLYKHLFAGRLAPLIVVSAGFTALALVFVRFLPVRPPVR